MSAFNSIWEKVTAENCTTTGLAEANVSSQSESIVAAKFFASTRQSENATGAFGTGAVCIDIGGETSDISIWHQTAELCVGTLRLDLQVGTSF